MKRNFIIKIFIDITMVILYSLLMFAKGLGGFFHETVGTGIAIIFIIHILMNGSMLKGLFRSVKNGNTGKMILLASDLALTICMPVVIVTGIFIAKELFVIQSGISWELLFNIHNVLSYVCLGIMVLHILFHAKYLAGVLKKLPSALSGKEMKSAIGRFSAGAFAAVLLYSSLALYRNTSDKHNLSDKSDFIDDKNNVSTVPAEISSDETEPVLNAIEEGLASDSVDEKTLITEKPTDESSIAQAETTPPPTLEEYLSGLICTGCGRRCSLLSPRCGRGHMQASQAEEEYNQIYYNN